MTTKHIAGSVDVLCFLQCFWRTCRSRRSSLMHFTSQSLYWWGLRSHFSVQFMFDEVIDFPLPLLWMRLSVSLLSVLCVVSTSWCECTNTGQLPLAYYHSSHSALQSGSNLLIIIWTERDALVCKCNLTRTSDTESLLGRMLLPEQFSLSTICTFFLREIH